MQDLSTTASSTIEASPSASSLPPDLFERIAAADVVILIGSSEQQDKALTVQTVLAAPAFEPETIASHAYTLALHAEHGNLLRKVRGVPTDGDRFRALRDLAVLAGTDPARFEAVNTMLQRFEDDNPKAGKHPTTAEAERMADFLVHALVETAPEAPATQPVEG